MKAKFKGANSPVHNNNAGQDWASRVKAPGICQDLLYFLNMIFECRLNTMRDSRGLLLALLSWTLTGISAKLTMALLSRIKHSAPN